MSLAPPLLTTALPPSSLYENNGSFLANLAEIKLKPGEMWPPICCLTQITATEFALCCATSQNKDGAEVKWPTHPDVTQVLTTISGEKAEGTGACCQHSPGLWRFSADAEPPHVWRVRLDATDDRAARRPENMGCKCHSNQCVIEELWKEAPAELLCSARWFFLLSLPTRDTTDVWHRFTFGRIKEFRRPEMSRL